MSGEVEGFGGGAPDGYSSEPELDTRRMVQEQNRKKKKSGGFQSMGLSQAVFRGIMKKGYTIPTPIQRKAIPVALEGKDVVAMARTGSGKTACFLIPLMEKLKARSAKAGARALVLSPTRELAVQTLKFFREIGKFTGLKAAAILGGDSMDAQFSAVHESPDLIVATPGRFVHVCVEMELRMSAVEIVVFDEADRLFEMGFGEQLHEILKRIPEHRQTMLFSATLPKMLVEFARAGLSDPVLIRLDVDTKIPENLKTAFLHCRSEDKPAILLRLLKEVIRPSEQNIIFAATKHHVDYVHMLLEQAQISSTFIYSSLDPSARKINAAKFQSRKVSVLVVTDVSARGIDIPLLDNVINYHFPAKPKLFVHRVGRVARAGRSGNSFSLVAPDETAYLLDLHLFLGRTMEMVPSVGLEEGKEQDGVIGAVPQEIVDDEGETIAIWHESNTDLENMVKVCENAYRLYIRSRPPASKESVKRVKNIPFSQAGPHPVFSSSRNNKAIQMLQQMKNYRPSNTIFEIGPKAGSSVVNVMRAKREHHQDVIERNRNKAKETPVTRSAGQKNTEMEGSTEAELDQVFQTVIKSKKRPGLNAVESRKKSKPTRDENYYVHHTAPDQHTETGFAVSNAFEQQASGAVLDFMGDDADMLRHQKNLLVWDQKKKKYIKGGKDLKKKKVLTESGTWISASYKSDAYKRWRGKNQMDQERQESSDEEEVHRGKEGKKGKATTVGRGEPRNNSSMARKSPGGKKGKRELLTPEEIWKARRLKALRRWRSRKKKGQKNAKKR